MWTTPGRILLIGLMLASLVLACAFATSTTIHARQQALTTVMYMYRTYANYSDAGVASAMSWLLFLVIGVLTLINNRVFGRSGLASGD